MLKLSELPDDTELTIEESNTRYTAAELKREIREDGTPHHKSTWYTIKEAIWTPNAEGMLERLIDDAYDDMYEGWDERAYDCITEEAVAKIQPILNEIFAKARDYWEYSQLVEIDVMPDEADSK